MNRRLLPLAFAAAFSVLLAACSDSSDDDSSGNGGGTATGADGGGTGSGDGSADGGTSGGGNQGGSGEPLLDGAFSGVYAVGGGELAGLALADDGSAVSLFGPPDGPFRRYDHVASSPATQGVFGPGEPAGQSDDFAPGESGQSIASGDGLITLRDASSGGVMSATPDTVAGRWSGRHRFLLAEEGRFLVTEVTFSGDTFSGQTRVVDDDGEGTRVDPITDGTLTQSGDALLVSFVWNGNTYDGVAFFVPNGTGQLAFVGETSGETGNPTIGSLLTIESN